MAAQMSEYICASTHEKFKIAYVHEYMIGRELNQK
jgi:hypothetical protein